MGVLVDQHDIGPTTQDSIDVHLVKRRPAVHDRDPRQDLQISQLSRGLLPSVGFHQPNHDIGTALLSATTFSEHRVGLAHARRGADVDA